MYAIRSYYVRRSLFPSSRVVDGALVIEHRPIYIHHVMRMIRFTLLAALLFLFSGSALAQDETPEKPAEKPVEKANHKYF